MIPIGERPWGFAYYASAVPYFRGILSGLLRQPLGCLSPAERRDVPPAMHAVVRREARLFWCVYLLIAAVSIHFGSWLAVELWLVPRVAGEPLMRVIRMSEHVGCARVPSMLANTRTVFTIAPLRLLAWNMAYHTAHHALPQAPFFRLASARRGAAGARGGDPRRVRGLRAHPLSKNGGALAASPGGNADDGTRCDGCP